MKRVATALVLIPLSVWSVLAAPQWVFLIVALAVGLGAHREFDAIAAAQGIRRSGVIGMAMGALLLLAPQVELVLVGVVLGAMILALRNENLSGALPAAAVTVIGVLYIFGAWRCGRELRTIDPHWLMIALLVNWAGDTAALYTGRAFGRRKLAPQISPSKTWEGAIGSVAGGVLAGVVYAHYLIPGAAPAIAVGVAALGNIAGQIGDLCESAFKRGAGVKDSGSSLPGHGGWLDRVDSALFGVPVVYALVKLTS